MSQASLAFFFFANILCSLFRFRSFWFVFDLCGLIKYQEVVAIVERLGNNECFRRTVNDSTPKSAKKNK